MGWMILLVCALVYCGGALFFRRDATDNDLGLGGLVLIAAAILAWQSYAALREAPESDLPLPDAVLTARLRGYAAAGVRAERDRPPPGTPENTCLLCCDRANRFACFACDERHIVCCRQDAAVPGCYRCCRYEGGLVVPYYGGSP